MSNKTQIATLLADNTTGAITPKDVRDAFDLVDTEQNLPTGVLKSDGTVPMSASYVPTKAKDLMTKEASFVVEHRGAGYSDGDTVAWSASDGKWKNTPSIFVTHTSKQYKWKPIDMTTPPDFNTDPNIVADDELGYGANAQMSFLMMKTATMAADPELVKAGLVGSFTLESTGKVAVVHIDKQQTVGAYTMVIISLTTTSLFVAGDLVDIAYSVSTLLDKGLVKEGNGYMLANEVSKHSTPGNSSIDLSLISGTPLPADIGADGSSTVAIGVNVHAKGDQSIVIGAGSKATGGRGVAIGTNVQISEVGAVNVGGVFEYSPTAGITLEATHPIKISKAGVIKTEGATIALVAAGSKNVATVEYIKSVVPKGIPDMPTADGEYKLKVAAGVATWVTI